MFGRTTRRTFTATLGVLSTLLVAACLATSTSAQDVPCASVVCGDAGYCNGQEVGNICQVNCKGSTCDCQDWAGDCQCTTNCDGGFDGALGILAWEWGLIAGGVFLFCCLPCICCYFCGQANARGQGSNLPPPNGLMPQQGAYQPGPMQHQAQYPAPPGYGQSEAQPLLHHGHGAQGTPPGPPVYNTDAPAPTSASQNIPHCPGCGTAQNSATARFCYKCGGALTSATPQE
eukprot:m.183266 g.183266  ORF g.183266 m.183266 type:complete len:231 (+) comp15768_c0_seq1:110-802(+)